ncbi:unnamed protein product [Closterium sp. NIES-53]
MCAETCKELLEAGLIGRSKSEFAAAIVVVSWKDIIGEVSAKRMCRDYRRPNKVTVPDPVPTAAAIPAVAATAAAAAVLTAAALTAAGAMLLPHHQDQVPTPVLPVV